ncbi:glycoside hydrolase family 3 protein [Mycena belliarum]|uniref:xylan 1,4-beta-xylosidase n=1 Tax=Mycena belliarum TaxID=1033014 RepID=A0AAD6TQ54_9AGAR|nr:glycoside hydrolase family 3 protein [Mycena belliae]KAJ7075756.1 glycoside hydrolase family 3 protein [Mycena belliae]KAJ7094761.1 glycoside hydrolase family 3 protein [Mycena belliae]
MLVETVLRLLVVISGCAAQLSFSRYSFDSGAVNSNCARDGQKTKKDAFIDALLHRMTVTELVLQLHLMFADNMVGPNSDNGLYDFAMSVAPTAGVGVVHDWYPTNKSQFNSLQKLNIEKSRLKVPFLQTGECLHGVGSFKQSMFPQAIGLAASFDKNLAYSVGRAIGAEARSIGIHACFSPVVDLGKDPRWGRVQEAWGEDYVLTSHMAVAYSAGLSKNGSWAEPDAVVPVVKHFAAHGSPRGGLNAAPFMGRGSRQVLMEMLVPFKAVIDLGGAKGVMMAYNELDDVPAVVSPMLYDALEDWGYDGFIVADDNAMKYLLTRHTVADSIADTIQQWFNAGGGVQFYDFTLDIFLNTTLELVANHTISKSTLRKAARRVLATKYDLGLFDEPYIPESVDSAALTEAHVPLTLDAAHRSIVLLENRHDTLPIKPAAQGIKSIALIGPFSDTLNYGDYSGPWGSYPTANSSTLRQAMAAHLAAAAPDASLLSSWGSNTWLYNGQYNIPGYLLSVDGVPGGLRATYYSDTNFTHAAFTRQETPNLDWGLYPPVGLPSNNFSVVWEGKLSVPVDRDVSGWIGVGVNANTTARLFVDGALVADSPLTLSGNIIGNIKQLSYDITNGTGPPPGASSFTFVKGATHSIRVEFQAWNYVQKIENVNSINAQIELFWNLVDQVDPVKQAVDVAKSADLIVLAVGANWNSDGESADRATLGLSANQTVLADAMFALDKPVVIVLQGGRPFAIPDYYSKAAAVLDAFFPGQRSIGLFNPGGRVPLSVPYDVGVRPVLASYKYTAHAKNYTDIYSFPSYSFGHGLSYSTFSVSGFNATSTHGVHTFSAGETINFRVTVKNEGPMAGSYVPQVYLLVRVSTVTQPLQQLVAFDRVYLDVGASATVVMPLEVDRYLPIVNRRYEWELERGNYVFALMERSGVDADKSTNVTMTCCV